jgi:hypothetical protein
MIKRNWKVWTENEQESRKQDCIAEQKVLFEGNEKEVNKYFKKASLINPDLHIGYELTEDE